MRNLRDSPRIIVGSKITRLTPTPAECYIRFEILHSRFLFGPVIPKRGICLVNRLPRPFRTEFGLLAHRINNNGRLGGMEHWPSGSPRRLGAARRLLVSFALRPLFSGHDANLPMGHSFLE